MPHRIWNHECCSGAAWLRPSSPTCPHCGKLGEPAGWAWGAIEQMGRYQRKHGLKVFGPHRGLIQQLLAPLRVTCERCGGYGITGELDWKYCPVCEGGGGVWSAPEQVIMAAYRLIIDEFPEAEAPGALSPLPLPRISGTQSAKGWRPYPSLEEMIRSEGQLLRTPVSISNPHIAIVDWDGWFYRISVGIIECFETVEEAESHRTELAFQWCGGEEGVLLSLGTWERMKAIQDAVWSAGTWGELRQMLPEDEFEALPIWFRNDGDHAYVEGTELLFGPAGGEANLPDDWKEYVIKAEDDFDPAQIPGVTEANYPDWLGVSEELQLPQSFVEEFGTRVGSPVNGVWRKYPVDRIEEMTEVLKGLRFEVSVVKLDGSP